MSLDSARSAVFYAARAAGSAALGALLYALTAFAGNVALLYFISGGEWTGLGQEQAWTVGVLFAVGFPLLFGWLGWMQGLAENARDVIERYAPDVSSLVFAKLEARIGAAGLDTRLDAADAGVRSLIGNLRAGAWLSELPPPLARVLRFARKVSDPVDTVAQAFGAAGSREASAREVLERAEAVFAARLAEFRPGNRAGLLVLAVVVNLAVWIAIKLAY